jgi:hypothetical protein
MLGITPATGPPLCGLPAPTRGAGPTCILYAGHDGEHIGSHVAGPPGVTTNVTIVRDLERSLDARGVGLPNRCTVDDFVRAILALGIGGGEELAAIEWHIASTGNGRLCVERDDDGAVTIREGKR